MRIISQEGFCYQDIPYEYSAFYMSTSGTHIYANCNGVVYSLAEYSTVKKAEKAMLLLHKIYVKAPLENEAKEMGEFVRGTFKAIGTSGYVEPESNYFVFRFPREDEI